MRVEDVFIDQRRLWVCLNEKGGSRRGLDAEEGMILRHRPWSLDLVRLGAVPFAASVTDR